MNAMDILTTPMKDTDLADFVGFLEEQRDYQLVKGWFYTMYKDFLDERELEELLNDAEEG